MLNGPSIGALGAVSSLKTKFLPSSADTWSSQLIVDAFPSGIRARKVAGSFRKGNLLEESLSVVTFGVVGVLGLEPTLSSSHSPKEDEDKASEEGFLETEEVETPLKEHLVM